MTSRGRDRYYDDRYDDGYDSYEDDHPEERRTRARRKSTTQSIMDRASKSIGRPGINRSPSRTRSRRDHDYTPSPSPPPTNRRPGYSRRRSVTDNYYPPLSSRYRPASHRRGSSYSPSDRGAADRRDKSRWEYAAGSVFDAALVETARVRKEPGPWMGPKGRRVATAALGAAAMNVVVAGGTNEYSKRKKVESALGGVGALSGVEWAYKKDLRGQVSYR